MIRTEDLFINHQCLTQKWFRALVLLVLEVKTTEQSDCVRDLAAIVAISQSGDVTALSASRARSRCSRPARPVDSLIEFDGLPPVCWIYPQGLNNFVEGGMIEASCSEFFEIFFDRIFPPLVDRWEVYALALMQSVQRSRLVDPP